MVCGVLSGVGAAQRLSTVCSGQRRLTEHKRRRLEVPDEHNGEATDGWVEVRVLDHGTRGQVVSVG